MVRKNIPGYSTLVFDIDLVGIYRAGATVPKTTLRHCKADG